MRATRGGGEEEVEDVRDWQRKGEIEEGKGDRGGVVCADRLTSKQKYAKQKRKFFRFTAKKRSFSHRFASSENTNFSGETK